MANQGHSRLLFLYGLAKGDEGSEHTVTKNTKKKIAVFCYPMLFDAISASAYTRLIVIKNRF